jgi:hypothetical protein
MKIFYGLARAKETLHGQGVVRAPLVKLKQAV